MVDNKPFSIRGPLLEILADGEWHTFKEIYYAVEGLVPPDAAIRKVEQYPSGRGIPEEFEDRLKHGKATIIVNALSNVGPVEQQGLRNERWTRSYRWRPDLAPHREHGIGQQERSGAEMVLRSLVVQPAIRSLFEQLSKERSNELNPAQEHWLRVGLTLKKEEGDGA